MFLAPAAVAQIPNTLLHLIPAPSVGAQSGAQFGYSVAVDGGYTVVGAPLDDIGGQQNSGVVKVFDSASGALLHVIPNPSPAADDSFGIAVAISGTRIVVGGYQDDTGGTNKGSAYIYDLASAWPTVPVLTLNNPVPASTSLFGRAVSISGTRIAVGASGTKAFVYDLTGATPSAPAFTLDNPGPLSTDGFGESVSISGTLMVVGAYRDDTDASDTGIAYVYNLAIGTPTVPTVTLHNPAPVATDYFGFSVAISGSHVVIGAYRNDTNATDSGSAYVYDLNSGTPTVPVDTLINPDFGFNDQFGYSVAISGTKVVVGAYLDDNGAADAGSAYVYDIGGGSDTLNNPGPAIGDRFGWSVAVSGTRVVVGAYSDDTGASDAGSAYLYNLSGGLLATLNNPGPVANDQFSYSVSISGSRVVIGCPLDDTGFIDSGRVYVYDMSSGTPAVPVFTLNNPDPTASDQFGSSVAISGTRVVVGAYRDDAGATDAGSAYVYDLSSGTPTVPLYTLNNPGSAATDQFGFSVAISGTRIVVGAQLDDTGGTNAGSAYVYDLSSGTPTVPVVTLNNPGSAPTAADFFGYSVAISGTRVVIGAIFDDTGSTDAGSAYAYDISSGTPTVPVAILNNPSPAASDYFGKAVAISGAQVVVGAIQDDTGATDAGSAYVYDLTSGTPTVPTVILNNPSPVLNDQFAWSVAISGSLVVVGAKYHDTGATDAGSAYVFDLSSGTPTVPVVTLNNPSPSANDQFGFSAAIDGTNLVIGAPLDDTVMFDKGYAYIFGSHPLDLDGDGLRDTWELTYWPSISTHGPLDDSDQDGYCELLELALGLNPTLPDAGGFPAITNEGGYLTMTITKQAGVAYEVQSGGSLAPAQADSFNAATTTVLINDVTTLKVRDNYLIGTLPARFIRAQVWASP